MRNRPLQETKKESDNQHTKLTHFPLAALPIDVLLVINSYLSIKERARLSPRNQLFNSIFQPEIQKQAAKEAAVYTIDPTKENIEKLEVLLKNCPALLLHPVKVRNRHQKPIHGTVYQIALHEGDNELIEDVITPAFARLQRDGLEIMEAQRQAWLPEDWKELEESVCASAFKAIDNVFNTFKDASNPNDFTETDIPYTKIIINHQDANEALVAFRAAIDALYLATNKPITSGRDPIIRLLERVIKRFEENFKACGGYYSPRNDALMRSVFGYCQRFSPINFMQAFAHGVYYIVDEKQKLNRSFEYSDRRGHFILPLDSNPLFRLGFEYFVGRKGKDFAVPAMGGHGWPVYAPSWVMQNLLSIKNSSYSTTLHCDRRKGIAQ